MYVYTHIFMVAVYSMAVMGAMVMVYALLRALNALYQHVFVKMADYRDAVRRHDSLVAAVWNKYEQQ